MDDIWLAQMVSVFRTLAGMPPADRATALKAVAEKSGLSPLDLMEPARTSQTDWQATGAMLDALHRLGRRVELHNHGLKVRKSMTWSCRVGDLSRTGFIAKGDPRVYTGFGSTPGEAVRAAYCWATGQREEE